MSDRYVGIHTIVVPGTPRDGLYLLAGRLDPQTSVRPQQIMTDTAGYTDIMFGCYRILDFQLFPKDGRLGRCAILEARSAYRLRPTQRDRHQRDRPRGA
ncbi:MAG: Tn3 family transposase [Solirubrobacteraceae bacterium]|jgi:TnpA family transposase